MPTLDILLAFEDYSRVREREFDEQMRRAQVEKTRKERKAREAFKVGSHHSISLFVSVFCSNDARVGIATATCARGQDQG